MPLDWPALRKQLNAYAADLPEIAALPQSKGLVQVGKNVENGGSWSLPFLGGTAAGGTAEEAMPAAVAFLCMLRGAGFIDDVLDGDEITHFDHPHKEGMAANHGLMLNATAGTIIAGALDDPVIAARAQRKFHRAVRNLCIGQHKKLFVGRSEERYWEAVELASAGYFGFGLYFGALCAGDEETAARLSELGAPMARFIQIGDDMRDALNGESTADWREDQVNLMLLYALVANYKGKDEFLALYPKVHADPDALAEARLLLVRSGALAYCQYRIIEEYKTIREMVTRLDLPDPEPILDFVGGIMKPMRETLASLGVSLSDSGDLADRTGA